MWIEYNPNPCGRLVNDCAVRAIAKALDLTWEKAYVLLTHGNLDMIDKLAHATKNLDKVIESCDGYSGRRYMMAGRTSYDDGGSYRDSYRSGEYSRKRDAMGRYSRDDEMMAELRKLHGMANDEMQRESIERIMDICESK